MAFLSFIYARKFVANGSARCLVLSGVFSGLAFASKYTAVPYILAGFIMVLYACYIHRFSIVKVMIAWTVFSLSSFLLADPILWIDPAGRLYRSLFFHIVFR